MQIDPGKTATHFPCGQDISLHSLERNREKSFKLTLVLPHSLTLFRSNFEIQLQSILSLFLLLKIQHCLSVLEKRSQQAGNALPVWNWPHFGGRIWHKSTTETLEPISPAGGQAPGTTAIKTVTSLTQFPCLQLLPCLIHSHASWGSFSIIIQLSPSCLISPFLTKQSWNSWPGKNSLCLLVCLPASSYWLSPLLFCLRDTLPAQNSTALNTESLPTLFLPSPPFMVSTSAEVSVFYPQYHLLLQSSWYPGQNFSHVPDVKYMVTKS